MVAEAVAGLHGVNQGIGRRGDRPGLLHGVVSAAQAGHGAGKSIELARGGR